MRDISRRSLFVTAGAIAGMSTIAGCAGVAGGSAGGGGGASASGGTVRYAFWGNNVRQQNYQTAFDQMAETLPEISLSMEFADYGAFQERMTTQMAAGNVADIFWIPSAQVMTYYANDLYRDLSGVSSLDLSDYSDADVQDFQLAGELNTMPFATSVPVVRYNRRFADEDGVELPDDWDWDWFAEFARDYAANNPAGRYAVDYGPSHDLPFEQWLRQRGERLWTEDGQIGFSADGLGSWIAWWEDLRKAGATPSVGEQDGVQPSWEDVGDQCLMWFGNSNHIVDEATMFPDSQFALKHLPADADATPGHQFLYFPRMAIYQGISDEQAELAGQVVSYCTSTVEMLQAVGLTMGAPVNPRVAEEYAELANDVEAEVLRVTKEDREADRMPRYDAPPGSNTWRDVMYRTLEEVTLGNTSISEGVESMTAEINRSLERAK